VRAYIAYGLTNKNKDKTFTGNTSQRQESDITRYMAAATVCPAPLLPLWTPMRLLPPSRRQRTERSSSFPRPTRSHAHRCSRLTRKHGGQQSGLVTLTFDLLTMKVVSESRVMWATSVPMLVFLDLSVLDLGPMYATDKRQTKASLNAPAY